MKTKSNQRLIAPHDSINKLILHFNIDRTIIMRDSLSYDNSDIIVSIIYFLIYKILIYSTVDKRSIISINLGKRRQKSKWRTNIQSNS